MAFFATHVALRLTKGFLSIAFSSGMDNSSSQLHWRKWGLYFILAMEDLNVQ